MIYSQIRIYIQQFSNFSKKKKTSNLFVSLYEEKYIAKAETKCKAILIRGFLGQMKIFKTIAQEDYTKKIFFHTSIFANNEAAVELMENYEYHQKTKYILLKYHKTWELFDKRVLHFE